MSASAKSKLYMENKVLPKLIICLGLVVPFLIYNVAHVINFKIVFPEIIPRIFDVLFLMVIIICCLKGFEKTNRLFLVSSSIYFLLNAVYFIHYYGLYVVLNAVRFLACVLPLVIDLVLRKSSNRIAVIVVKYLSIITLVACAGHILVSEYGYYRWVLYNLEYFISYSNLRILLLYVGSFIYSLPFLEGSLIIFILCLKVRKSDDAETQGQVSSVVNAQNQFAPYDAGAQYSYAPVGNEAVNTPAEPYYVPPQDTAYQGYEHPVYSAPAAPVVSVAPVVDPVVVPAPVAPVYSQCQAPVSYDEATISAAEARDLQPVAVAPEVYISELDSEETVGVLGSWQPVTKIETQPVEEAPANVYSAPDTYISELDSEETVGVLGSWKPITAMKVEPEAASDIVVAPVIEEAPQIEGLPEIEEAPVVENPVVVETPVVDEAPVVTELPRPNFCAYCGAKLSSVGSFCTQCGKRIN